MDLISRKEVVSQIEFWLTDSTDYKSALEETLSRVKNTRSVFEGMTNGEVIKTIFPACENFTPIVRVFLESGSYIGLPVEWWDSPYKGESEEV